MKTTIDIPEPLYKQAKIRAVERGGTLRQVVLAALERDLAEPAVAEAPGSYWARRKLRPGFRQFMESGALKPQPGRQSVDAILDAVKADSDA